MRNGFKIPHIDVITVCVGEDVVNRPRWPSRKPPVCKIKGNAVSKHGVTTPFMSERKTTVSSSGERSNPNDKTLNNGGLAPKAGDLLLSHVEDSKVLQ